MRLVIEGDPNPIGWSEDEPTPGEVMKVLAATLGRWSLADYTAAMDGLRRSGQDQEGLRRLEEAAEQVSTESNPDEPLEHSL